MNDAQKIFSIKGMHCASCVRVLERALKKVDGVTAATVNLANEKATVTCDTKIATDVKLSSAVSGVGYTAMIGEDAQTEKQEKIEKQKELTDLRIKVIVRLVFGGLILWGSLPVIMYTAPLILVSSHGQLFLATIVQFWAGRTFYEATIPALRNRTANMDTLVALGTTVAFGYAVIVTLIPQLLNGQPIERLPSFDVAPIIIGLIL